MTTAPRVVGAPVPRIDGKDKVTGTANYGADFEIPGMLWAKTLRSPFPHARIRGIDTSAAVALPGVHAVLTGEDIPDNMRWGRRIVDVPVLAQGEVRFVGEQVAAVVADDEEIAQRALELIDVDYEELPAVTDPEEAMKNEVLVNPDMHGFKGLLYEVSEPTNVVVHFEWSKGDVEAGLQEADLVVENTYTTPSQHQTYMEAHNATVRVNPDGTAEVWTPGKAPYAVRSQISGPLGVEPESIVFHPVTIGGDFGGKGSPMNVALGYVLSKAVGGRPVRMVFDYAEEFLAANPRHYSKLRMRTGVKKDGSITAHDVSIVFDSGAYAGFKPAGHLGGAKAAGGPYRTENARVVEDMVYTHNTPCGHMRGPGEPQAVFALESHIDEVAKALGMDPVQFRLMNLVEDGEPTALGDVFVENRAAEALEVAVEASGYNAPKASGVGRGVSVGERPPGGGRINSQVSMEADGSVLITTPLFEQGAGAYTVLQQVVAEDLGLPADAVRMVVADTGLFDNDQGVGGSRVTNLGTVATHDAVGQAQEELFKLAAELQNWPEEKLVVQGQMLVRTDTGESQPWSNLIARVGTPVVGRGVASGGYENPVTGYCAQIAEVEVDAETGQIRLTKLTTVHDTGTIINPIGHQGQINGGAMMGIGFGLQEELVRENGFISTLSFADYKIPNIADIPELTTVVLDTPGQGVGPYNIKAIGESPNAPTAAAIANAIADACGVRVRDLPATAEKVYEALQDA